MPDWIGALLPSLIAGLQLVPPAGPGCPDVAAVRAGLEALGVGGREAVARWALSEGQVRLRVETLTASVAVERVLPAGSCDELAEALALAIERATAPLSTAASKDAPPGGPPVQEEGARHDGAIHLAGMVLLSPGAAFGLELGGEGWSSASPVGLAFVAGGTFPSSHAVGAGQLELYRLHVGAGAAIRWPDGFGSPSAREGPASPARDPLRPAFGFGISALALVDHVRGDPVGLLSPAPVRDLRLGGRVGAWVRWRPAPVELRLEAALRVFAGSAAYRAVPATELATLPAVEGQLLLGVGVGGGSGP